MEEDAQTNLKVQDDRMDVKPGWKNQNWRKICQIFVAEVVATALLMCLGCMGCVVGFDGSTSVHKLQPAFVFGFTVAALITAFGHISGAHMNPAVTICFYMMGVINTFLVPIYVAAELIGAVLGVGILMLITPPDILNYGLKPACTTVPDPTLSGLQAVTVEFVITALLLLVLLGCSDERNALKQDSVPLKFGATIIAISLLGGPYTGASLNPARSFAPALWTKEWTGQWVYWIGPPLAGFLTPLFYRSFFPVD